MKEPRRSRTIDRTCPCGPAYLRYVTPPCRCCHADAQPPLVLARGALGLVAGGGWRIAGSLLPAGIALGLGWIGGEASHGDLPVDLARKIVQGTTANWAFAAPRRASSQVCTALRPLCLLSSRSQVRILLGALTSRRRSAPFSRRNPVIFTGQAHGRVPLPCQMCRCPGLAS